MRVLSLRILDVLKLIKAVNAVSTSVTSDAFNGFAANRVLNQASTELRPGTIIFAVFRTFCALVYCAQNAVVASEFNVRFCQAVTPHHVLSSCSKVWAMTSSVVRSLPADNNPVGGNGIPLKE